MDLPIFDSRLLRSVPRNNQYCPLGASRVTTYPTEPSQYAPAPPSRDRKNRPGFSNPNVDARREAFSLALWMMFLLGRHATFGGEPR